MERLKQLRESKKLTQLRLSTMLYVTQETISGYETGKVVPPTEVLMQIADILNASVDYLLERTDIREVVTQSECSEDEIEILSIYRNLSAEQKNCVYKMLKGLA